MYNVWHQLHCGSVSLALREGLIALGIGGEVVAVTCWIRKVRGWRATAHSEHPQQNL